MAAEYRELKRTGTKQEISKDNFYDGWGRDRVPAERLSRHRPAWRRAERKPDGFDQGVAQANGQNPLMRMYDMAYLWRTYGELVANPRSRTCRCP